MAKRKFCEIAQMLINFIKLAGWKLFGVAIGWMNIFRGGNFLGGNYPGGNIPGGSYPGWEFSGWELSGWELFWVVFVRMGVILGGNFFWCGFSGWELSGGIIRVAIFRVGVFMLLKFLLQIPAQL